MWRTHGRTNRSIFVGSMLLFLYGSKPYSSSICNLKKKLKLSGRLELLLRRSHRASLGSTRTADHRFTGKWRHWSSAALPVQCWWRREEKNRWTRSCEQRKKRKGREKGRDKASGKANIEKEIDRSQSLSQVLWAGRHSKIDRKTLNSFNQHDVVATLRKWIVRVFVLMIFKM